MNILFLTSRFPFPPIGGDRLRPYYFIKELSKKHKVHLLSFAQKGETDFVDPDIKKRIKISTVRQSDFTSSLKTLINILKKEPFQVSYYYYKSMQKKLDAVIREEKIDIIFVHLIRMAGYIKGFDNIKKILDYSDAFSLLYNRSYRLRKDAFRLIDYIEKQRIGEFERKCLTDFNAAIISSDIDKKWIDKNIYNNKIHIVTNGIEMEDDIINMESRDEEPYAIAFIANMRSFSNRHAIINFVDNIFPRVRSHNKNAKLYVIGNDPPRALQKRFLKYKGIEITGKVKDVDAYLRRCSIGIAPMISCAGIQNKILKYMSFKIPVIATRIAIGDLKVIPDKDIILSHSNKDFAHKIISLLKDKERLREIGQNGYNYVKNFHRWEHVIEHLDRILSS